MIPCGNRQENLDQKSPRLLPDKGFSMFSFSSQLPIFSEPVQLEQLSNGLNHKANFASGGFCTYDVSRTCA